MNNTREETIKRLVNHYLKGMEGGYSKFQLENWNDTVTNARKIVIDRLDNNGYDEQFLKRVL